MILFIVELRIYDETPFSNVLHMCGYGIGYIITHNDLVVRALSLGIMSTISGLWF